MSMITSITNRATLPIERAGKGQERRDAFRDLNQAMQSEDLGAARSAYVGIVRSAPEDSTLQPGSPFAQLGQALVAGDMGAAKAAFGQMLPGREASAPGKPVEDTPAAALPMSAKGGSINFTV